MDTEKICRTCLALTGPFLSIFDGSTGSGAGCIADMLRDFTKTKPKRTDTLPEKVCLTCISEITRCYSFKQKCEQSNRTLRQLLQMPEELDVPNVPTLVEKLNKSAQTTPPRAKKTLNQESQTNNDVLDDLEVATIIAEAIDITTAPIELVGDATNKLKSQKNIQEQRRSKSDLKMEEHAESDDTTELFEIAELDSADQANVGIVDIEKLNESDNSIIVHLSKDDNVQFTEMIYDESTGELHAKDDPVYSATTTTNKEAARNEEEEAQLNVKNNKAEYKFTIYNNENGEAEFAPSPIHTRSSVQKRKAAATAAATSNTSITTTTTTTTSKPRVKRIATEKAHGVLDIKSPVSPKKRRVVENNSQPADSVDESKLQYFCERCNAGFALQKSLSIHQRSLNCTKKSYMCEICERVFISAEHLLEHQVIHENERHNCTECSQSFESKETLSKHMIDSHKRSSKNQCDICHKVFTMLSALRDHMRIHTGEKPFVCNICQKGFTQNANLRQHVFRHFNTKRFACDQCSSGFVTKAELVSHKRSHTGDKPYSCDVCAAKFTTSSSLMKHKRKHTGERPYACQMCPMRFSALNVLKNHRRTHTGEKPFACPHCPRRFTQNGDCLMHQRTHQEQDKIYLCPVCNDEFKNMSDMREHLSEHTRKNKSLRVKILGGIKEHVIDISPKRSEDDDEAEFIQLTMEEDIS